MLKRQLEDKHESVTKKARIEKPFNYDEKIKDLSELSSVLTQYVITYRPEVKPKRRDYYYSC